MMVKKNRTIELYRRAGAGMRLLKCVAGQVLMDVSGVLSSPDQDRMMRAIGVIDQICSRAEDNMFHDFPELSNDYLAAFYGDISDEPRNEVDREQIELARKVVDELFERKDY